MTRRLPFTNEGMSEETGRLILRHLMVLNGLCALLVGKFVLSPLLVGFLS